MENNNVHRKVAKLLHDFETMEEIHPSAAWNGLLMERVNQLKPAASVSSSFKRFNGVIILFVLINLCFVVNALIMNSPERQYREKELMEISKELLVNPTSINH